MTFKRTAALVASSVALLLGTLTAPAMAAPKVSLIRSPQSNCERGADAIPGSGSPSASYVITQSAKDSVAVQIKLRDANSNSTYNVFVIQSDGDLEGPPFDCFTQDGTLTTDEEGIGEIHLKEEKLPGANSFHVYTYSLSGGAFDLYDTRLIPFE
jgi:hypothetical protein